MPGHVVDCPSCTVQAERTLALVRIDSNGAVSVIKCGALLVCCRVLTRRACRMASRRHRRLSDQHVVLLGSRALCSNLDVGFVANSFGL